MKHPNIILNIDKPVGLSSFDIIRRIKKKIPKSFGKIGHFGTLDPFATGVLMVGIGDVNRLNNYTQEFLPKTYRALGQLGVKTATGDLTVAPDESEDQQDLKIKLSRFDISKLNTLFKNHFIGEYWQKPPMYSASKKEGRCLYEYARAGEIVERKAKQRHIYHLEVMSFDFPYLELEVRASSGTYIRTLFEDCAQLIGTWGALSTLRRCSIGHVTAEAALQEKILPGPNFDGSETTGEILPAIQAMGMTPVDLLPFRKFHFGKTLAQRFSHGQRLPFKLDDLQQMEYSAGCLKDEKYIWIAAEDHEQLLGLAKLESDDNINGLLTPQVVFP